MSPAVGLSLAFGLLALDALAVHLVCNVGVFRDEL